MATDPLGLAGRYRDIPETPQPPQKRKVTISIRADKDATPAEKQAAVDALFREIRAQKKRDKWNYVD